MFRLIRHIYQRALWCHVKKKGEKGKKSTSLAQTLSLDRLQALSGKRFELSSDALVRSRDIYLVIHGTFHSPPPPSPRTLGFQGGFVKKMDVAF